MSKPSPEKIEFLKSQFPDRSLYNVEAVAVDKDTGDESVATFVMTGPTRAEYKIFTNKLIAAKETKDAGDRLWAMRQVIENAALAQIRWPEREEVEKIFDLHPEMVDNFSGELQKAAGSTIELRSSKL